MNARESLSSMVSVHTVCAKGARDQVDTVDVVLRSYRAEVLVFFPGDISASQEEMMSDSDLSLWQDWSTESIATMLAARFPELHIILIRPSRQHDGYSCFDHFLETDATGDPFNGNYKASSCTAAEHLLLLLQDISATFGHDRVSLCQSLHVLGFSKGGTVLNQLLTEIGSTVEEEDEEQTATTSVSFLVSALRALVWLDSGVNDGCCVFISDENVMRLAAGKLRLTQPPTQLRVVFSPFQLYSEDYMYEYDDEEIPATSLELGLDRLQSVMLQECIPFQVELCCFDREASLQTHFQVIQEFTFPAHLSKESAPGQTSIRAKRSTTFAAALNAARSSMQRAKTLSLTCACM